MGDSDGHLEKREHPKKPADDDEGGGGGSGFCVDPKGPGCYQVRLLPSLAHAELECWLTLSCPSN